MLMLVTRHYPLIILIKKPRIILGSCGGKQWT